MEPPLRPSSAERRTAGKALRDRLHRTEQGAFAPPGDRADLAARLKALNAQRRQDLLPIKWGRMAASPFAFFRGSAGLFAADLGPGPATGIQVQLCGDAHLLNLGAYAAPDGHLVFDLNDFDESLTGPWEWDLKRLCASVVLAGREAGHSDRSAQDAVLALVWAYREGMARFAEMKALELVRFDVLPGDHGPVLKDVLAKATRDTPARLLDKVTEGDADGGRRFQAHPPLLAPVPEAMIQAVLAAWPGYGESVVPGRQQVLEAYQPVDIAFRVVGTGSVGTTCLVALCFGRGPDDPLFLQFKSEEPSVWTPYLPQGGGCSHQGRRVALGQHRMQTWVDPFLGWTRFEGQDFLVRQWSDHKASISVEVLKGPLLQDYAGLCGGILAKAHARTGDAAMLAGYLGDGDKLDQALAAFSQACADQVERDHRDLLAAIRSGILPALTAL
jgi:uncharacterized protein (DUF2252 family)